MPEARLFSAVNVTKDQIQEIFDRWGLTVVDTTAMSGGLVNTNIRVQCEDAVYLLRIYNEARTLGEVEFEISVLNRLSDAGVPAQRPLPAPASDSMIGDQFYTVLSFLDGEPLQESELTPELCGEIGVGLARLQTALRGFHPRGEKERCDVAFIDRIFVQSLENMSAPDESQAARTLEGQWEQARRRFVADDLPMGVVHADLYPGNTIVKGGKVQGFIDFDDAYYGTAFFDTAIAAMEYAFVGETDLDLGLMASFVRGFESEAGPVDYQMLVEGMWANCFRFFSYTLPLTLGAGEPWSSNVYAKRIALFSDVGFRKRVAAVLAAGR